MFISCSLTGTLNCMVLSLIRVVLSLVADKNDLAALKCYVMRSQTRGRLTKWRHVVISNTSWFVPSLTDCCCTGMQFCNFFLPLLQDWDLATYVLSQLNLSDFKKRFYDLGLKKFHYIIVHNLIAYNVYHSVQLLVCCHLRYNHGSKTRTCHVILKPWLYSFKP